MSKAELHNDPVFQESIQLINHIYNDDFVAALRKHSHLHLIHGMSVLRCGPMESIPYALVAGVERDGLLPIHVVFQGTKTFKHVLVDLMAFQVFSFEGVQGKVHRGFLQAATKISLEPFVGLLNDGIVLGDEVKTVELIFGGHSMGAALAQLVAALLIAKTHLIPSARKRVSVIGLGSPLVGNSAFCKSLTSEQIKRNTQIINQYDVVPALFQILSGALDSVSEKDQKSVKAQVQSIWPKLQSVLIAECWTSTFAKGLVSLVLPLVTAGIKKICEDYHPHGEYSLIGADQQVIRKTGAEVAEHFRATYENLNLGVISLHSCLNYYNELIHETALPAGHAIQRPPKNLSLLLRPVVSGIDTEASAAQLHNGKIKYTIWLKGNNLGFVHTLGLRCPDKFHDPLAKLLPCSSNTSLGFTITLSQDVNSFIAKGELILRTKMAFNNGNAPTESFYQDESSFKFGTGFFQELDLSDMNLLFGKAGGKSEKRTRIADLPLMKLFSLAHTHSILLKDPRLNELLDTINDYGETFITCDKEGRKQVEQFMLNLRKFFTTVNTQSEEKKKKLPKVFDPEYAIMYTRSDSELQSLELAAQRFTPDQYLAVEQKQDSDDVIVDKTITFIRFTTARQAFYDNEKTGYTVTEAVKSAATTTLACALCMAVPTFRLNTKSFWIFLTLGLVFGTITVALAATGVGLLVFAATVAFADLAIIGAATLGAMAIGGAFLIVSQQSTKIEKEYHGKLCAAVEFLRGKEFEIKQLSICTIPFLEEQIVNSLRPTCLSNEIPMSDQFHQLYMQQDETAFRDLCHSLGRTPSKVVQAKNERKFMQFVHKVLIVQEIRQILASVGFIGVIGMTKAGKTSLIQSFKCDAKGDAKVHTLDVRALSPNTTAGAGKFYFLDFPGSDDADKAVALVTERFSYLIDFAVVVIEAQKDTDPAKEFLERLPKWAGKRLVCLNMIDSYLEYSEPNKQEDKKMDDYGEDSEDIDVDNTAPRLSVSTPEELLAVLNVAAARLGLPAVKDIHSLNSNAEHVWWPTFLKPRFEGDGLAAMIKKLRELQLVRFPPDVLAWIISRLHEFNILTSDEANKVLKEKGVKRPPFI